VSAPERGIALAAGGVALAGAGLLVLTQSRAGWLGALAGLGALVWLSRGHPAESTPAQRRRRLIFATLAGGLVVGALPLAGGWASAQVAAGTGGALETVAFRLEVWRYALEAIGDFPFTGTGLGAFRRVVLRLYPITAYPNPDVAHAHNIFLQVALDTGLPGLAAYLGLLWAVAAESRRRLRATGGEGAAQALGVLATLAAFHVFGLADAIAPGAKPGLLFWWLLGLAVAPGEAEGPRAAQPAPPPG
jgi:putative inorganic carbon (HCO3(-)) transporter